MPASLDDLEADRLQGAEDPFEWRVDRELGHLRRARDLEGLTRPRRWPNGMSEIVISLPDDLKAVVDLRAPNRADRDRLVADALRRYLTMPLHGEDRGDLAIINSVATELNAEAEDALSYQVPR